MVQKRLLIFSALALTLCAPTLPVQAGQSVPASAGRARPLPPAEARVRMAAIWREIRESGFSGAVRIDMGDETLIRAAAGHSDPVAGRAFTPETQFQIGSLTKAFTAAAILKLQDEGQLTVQDPVSRFFPETATTPIGRVTVHQLLTHSSGVPISASPRAEDREPIDRAAFLERLFQVPLEFEPGARLEYSNAGYGLLAAIIEVASGQSYDAYLRSRIFDPVDADRTGYPPVIDLATAVRTYDGQTLIECCIGEGGPYWNLLGNGGHVSTLDEFITWRKAFAAGRIVSAEAVRMAAQPHVAGPDGPGGEGYGWIIAPTPHRGPVHLAAGGNGHFTTEMRYYPEYGIVSVVTASSGERPGEIAGRLIAAAFGEPDSRPETPNTRRRLVENFVAAVQSTDADRRRTFLDATIGPVFRQRVGLETIERRFSDESARLQGAVVETMNQSGAGARIVFRLPDGSRTAMRLHFGGGPENPRLAGFESMD